MKLGLCCTFESEPIRFRRVTAKTVSVLSKKERLKKIKSIGFENAVTLERAITYCSENGIGSFRVNSQILPLKTHEQFGYSMAQLGSDIKNKFESCGGLAMKKNIRLTFHPDQFVVLNSPREEVVRKSLLELEYQGEIARWIGADVINIHGGGGYGDKPAALRRLQSNVGFLSDEVRKRLTLENDDRTYTPSDLLPVCDALRIPFVYDVHHHRCNPDGRSVAEITESAVHTWDREPLFHISSPKGGWGSATQRSHADDIHPDDFPSEWKTLPVTIEVEAKAKENAVRRLKQWLAQ